jgi:hypothetical protein
MTDLLHSPAAIRDFRLLESGRRRRQVVIVDAHERIQYVGTVRHNHPSHMKLVFETPANVKTFDMGPGTIDGEKVSVFLS